MKFIPAERMPYRDSDPIPRHVLLRPVAIVWVTPEVFTADADAWVLVMPISGERMRARAGVLRRAFSLKREQLEVAA